MSKENGFIFHSLYNFAFLNMKILNQYSTSSSGFQQPVEIQYEIHLTISGPPLRQYSYLFNSCISGAHHKGHNLAAWFVQRGGRCLNPGNIQGQVA